MPKQIMKINSDAVIGGQIGLFTSQTVTGLTLVWFDARALEGRHAAPRTRPVRCRKEVPENIASFRRERFCLRIFCRPDILRMNA